MCSIVLSFNVGSCFSWVSGKDPIEGQAYSGFINDTLKAALDSRREDVRIHTRALSLLSRTLSQFLRSCFFIHGDFLSFYGSTYIGLFCIIFPSFITHSHMGFF